MAKANEELSSQDLEVLMKNAVQVVEQKFDPAHLPPAARSFLEPISTSSCQGLYVTCTQFAGAMAALSNGAAVRMWSQKASPLALMVFHVAPAQRGKSRLFQATDILFETADDILEDKARQHAQTFREGDGAAEGEIAFLVKSISVQSCTPTEFFFRCSADFPQCRAGYICSSLWTLSRFPHHF